MPIVLRLLTRRFGSTLAVDRVDLHIHAGELFFLLGPSGCGKTTLMRLVAGLTRPDAGSIHFGARDMTGLPTARRNTAMVFQGYALWPHMTVAQNVAFGLDVRRVPRAEKKRRVAEALAAVRLTGLEDRRPHQLSGGQQQRVALARALVVRPDVLLLDEPLSNLDASLRLEMRGEIRRICAEARLTALYVTHDQDEALSIADRIAVMRDGRVLQVGTPSELYDRPASRFIAQFMGATNFIYAEVVGRDDQGLILRSPLGIIRSGKGDATGAITCSLRPEAIRILDNATTDGEIVFEARHLRSAYLGHVAHHLFQAAGDLHLTVEEHRPRPRDWSARPVQLGFDARDLAVLPREN